jgi:hypothetical protein
MKDFASIDPHNSRNSIISGSNMLIADNNVNNFVVIYNVHKKKSFVEVFDGNKTYTLNNMKCN